MNYKVEISNELDAQIAIYDKYLKACKARSAYEEMEYYKRQIEWLKQKKKMFK